MKTKQLLFLIVCIFVFANTYAANRYWVGGTAANWTATTSWSESSSGTPGATVPGASDDVIFDNTTGNENPTVYIFGDLTVNSITFTSSNVTFTGSFTQATTNSVITTSPIITLSATNANIKVGQTVTLSGTGAGTLQPNTTVAAISGKTLTLSQNPATNSTAAGTLTFAASTITTTNMTVTSSQVVFTDNVIVNSALTFSGTNSRITQNSPSWGKAFKMGNGGEFTLTGNSATNYFGGKASGSTTGYTFDTTSALTVYFDSSITFGGITVLKGLITLGNDFKIIRLMLAATNSQELILAPNVTFTIAAGGSSAFTANGGVINASASGSKVIVSAASPTFVGVQSPGAAIAGRIFKENSIINHLEYNSTAVFYLPQAIRVRTLTLTAGIINNSTNSITIEDGGNIVNGAGSTTAPVLLSSAIHSVSKTSEPVFHYNNGIVTLKYNSDSMDKVHFKLMNLNGQLIFSKSIQSSAGTNTVSLSIGELPSGIYLTSISDGVNSLTDKIILK